MVLNELDDLINKCREAKAKANDMNVSFNLLKEKLRVFMIDSGIKNYNGVEIRRNFSFDIGMFKMYYPKLAEIFVDVEIITKNKNVISKKNKEIIQKEHLSAFRECNVENTPQVRGL